MTMTMARRLLITRGKGSQIVESENQVITNTHYYINEIQCK